jgi:hypothetical protein
MRLGSPIDYLSSRGDRLKPDSVSWGRTRRVKSSDPAQRLLMLIVVIAGILTFFLPLISVDPPVVGRRLWSPFKVVEEAYDGNLSQPVCERCAEPAVKAFVALPLDVTIIYLLILSTLVPISVPYGSEIVSGIAALAGIASLYLGKGRMTAHVLADTLYGPGHFTGSARTGHVDVHTWPLHLALLGVSAGLFFLANSEVVIKRPSRTPSGPEA